jgi:hypothetical protein
MQLFMHKLKELPVIKWVIYCIALCHIMYSIDAIATFGIGFTEDVHWRTLFVIALTMLYILAAIVQNRFVYYAYILLCIASMLLVFAFTDYNYYCTIFRAMFPMHLLFAGVLILDLQRVIFLAHRNRSTAK